MKITKFIFLTCLMAAVSSHASVQDFNSFIEMANNQHLNMNSRWTSLVQSANYVEGDQQVNEIKKFSEDKAWYLRNASLVALAKISPREAEAQARKLIQDKALVVRSAAVEVLAQNLTDENKNIMIDEIQKNYNFNKKSSLWIRKQILDKLAAVATAKDQNVFVKTLFDNDKAIAELSADTLEKITGEKLERKKFVENWRQLAKQRNWM
ncbi:MAG: HEAT repeat domain-containing protein [Pseudobdellovibrio sp.]